jgi:hypothetical protein
MGIGVDAGLIQELSATAQTLILENSAAGLQASWFSTLKSGA